MKNSINLTTLKKYLKVRSQEQLIDEIADLYKRFSEVQDYYQVKIQPENKGEVLAKYKKIIENQFFPPRGIGNAKLSVAKKAIADYKKVGNQVEDLIDIMLFYVEQGVLYTLEYGDIDAPFYMSIESVYDKAVETIVKSDLKDQFQNRCYGIVTQTKDMGWGFHDTLKETYKAAF